MFVFFCFERCAGSQGICEQRHCDEKQPLRAVVLDGNVCICRCQTHTGKRKVKIWSELTVSMEECCILFYKNVYEATTVCHRGKHTECFYPANDMSSMVQHVVWNIACQNVKANVNHWYWTNFGLNSLVEFSVGRIIWLSLADCLFKNQFDWQLIQSAIDLCIAGHCSFIYPFIHSGRSLKGNVAQTFFCCDSLSTGHS